MAEEKSAPKKEKPAKAAAEGASAAPSEKKARSPKAAAAVEKPVAAGSVAPDAAPAPAAEQKPVEMVHGVARQPTAEELLKEELGAIKVRKAKGSKNVTSGIANVLASFNNTIVSITDLKGAVISWSTAGKCNFRGSRKSTAYAAQVVAQDAATMPWRTGSRMLSSVSRVPVSVAIPRSAPSRPLVLRSPPLLMSRLSRITAAVRASAVASDQPR